MDGDTYPGCGRDLDDSGSCPEFGPVNWDWWGERVHAPDDERDRPYWLAKFDADLRNVSAIIRAWRRHFGAE